MSSRNRSAPILVLLVFAGYPFVKFGFVQVWDYVGGDWEIFYRASRNIAAGMSPYSFENPPPDDPDGVRAKDGQYVYPPFFARVLTPLTLLPPVVAKRIYVASALLLYLFLLWPGKIGGRNQLIHQAIQIIFLLGWGATIEDFRFGQSNFIPLFCFAIAMRMLQARDPVPFGKFNIDREFLAGAICGVGCSIKLTPLIIVPVLVVTARWRMVSGVLLGFFANCFLWGPRDCLVFFRETLPSLYGFTWAPEVYCLHTFALHYLPRLGVSGWLFQSSIVCGMIYSCLLLFFFVKRRSLASKDLVPIGCYLSVLFGGLWFNHYTLALLPLLLVAPRLADRLVRKPIRSTERGIRLDSGFPIAVVFFAALTPCFTHWGPLSDLFYWAHSLWILPRSMQIFLGNVIAFGIFLHTILQGGARTCERDRRNPVLNE